MCLETFPTLQPPFPGGMFACGDTLNQICESDFGKGLSSRVQKHAFASVPFQLQHHAVLFRVATRSSPEKLISAAQYSLSATWERFRMQPGLCRVKRCHSPLLWQQIQGEAHSTGNKQGSLLCEDAGIPFKLRTASLCGPCIKKRSAAYG